MYSTIRNLIYTTVVLLFAISNLDADQHVKIPSEFEAKLILTALTYDKNLGRNGKHELVIVVFYLKNSSEAKKEAERFFSGLSAYQDKLVKGLKLKTFLHGYETIADFKEKSTLMNADCVYITTTKKSFIKEIKAFTCRTKILTITGNVDYARKYALSMAVGEKDKRPRIYLNLNSATAEGADFESRFLRVADIVGQQERRTEP